VPVADEREPDDRYKGSTAKFIAMAKRRPLTRQELDRLMMRRVPPASPCSAGRIRFSFVLLNARAVIGFVDDTI